MSQTPIADAMREKLDQAFQPSFLEVVDESHLHAGHRGAAEHAAEHGSAESHFRVTVVSDRFREIPRVARQRAVMEVLKEEMPKIHAISITAREGDTPNPARDRENVDPETGKAKGWATKDTTKSLGL